MVLIDEPDEISSASIDIYRNMRNKLVAGGFEIGIKLKPETIRKTYDCAASTIREVLFRLSCDGFVSFEEQRGFRVPTSSNQILRELTSMRSIIEREGARQSIKFGDLDWEARFNAAHHKLAYIESKIATTNDIAPYVEVWSQAEWEFHNTLISACHSTVLHGQHRNFYDRVRQHQLLNDPESHAFRPETLEEHAMILHAALDRDTELCCRLIEEHLHSNLLAYFDQHP
ncbi:GntR family transcriptional regulator [Alphaproteobacteria bacterium]|nr:GntR family transcriptional regulator [Alphaproteobacteria bacterium]